MNADEQEAAEQRAADLAYRNRILDQISAKVREIIDDSVAEKLKRSELAHRIALHAMAGSIPHVEVKL